MDNLDNMANPDNTANSIANTGNTDNTNSKENMKNILFTWFCISSVKYLNLGLNEKQRTCLYEECLEMGKNCLYVAMESNEKQSEMKVCSLLREASYVLNHYDDAIVYGNRAVDIAKSLGDKLSEANAYCSLNSIHFSSGHYSDALSCVLNYIEIREQSGLTYEATNADYYALGMTYSRLKEFQEAISCCKRSLGFARQGGDKYGEMRALLGLGKLFEETHQYKEALSHSKECISVIQEINSLEASEMDTTFDDTRVYNPNSTGGIKKGSYHNARLAEAAVKAYYNLGNAEAFLKMNQDAIVSFKTCAKLAIEIRKEDAMTMSFYAIASLYDLLSQWGEVIPFCKRCMHQLSGSKEIETYVKLAKAYMHTNQYDEAIVYGNKCIEMIQGTEDTGRAEMGALVILGKSYLNLNKYDEAIRCGDKYLEIAKSTYHREAETEAHFLLASIYDRLDQIGSVFLHATKGITIAEEMKNDTAIDNFKPLLSRFFAVIGMHEKAFTYSPRNKVIFEVPKRLEDELRALEKARKADDRNELALVLIRLYIYYKSKHQYKKAIECVKEIMALQPTCIQTQLFCYTAVGDLYIRMKQDKEGLQYCEAGLREAKECSDKKTRFDFFSCISVLYALNNDLHLAEEYLNKAIQCFEALYGSLGSNSDFKISIVDKYCDCFRFMSLLYLQNNRKKEALIVLDRCRARALKDLLVADYGMEKGESSDEVAYSDIESLVASNKFAILYYSICGFGNALAFLVAANYFEASGQQVQFDKITYNQMIDKMFEEITLDNEQDAQQQQNEEEQDEERELMLLQLKKRTFAVHKREICMYDYNGRRSQGAASELLYCLIIGEGESLIKQDEVIIIPDGSLCKIPFAALRDPDTGRYLSETKRIRLAPSIATLKLLQNCAMDRHHQSGALIIGDPLVGKVMINGEEEEVSSLKGALEEAVDIALILGMAPPLLREEATKAAVIEKLQQGESIVHIAAHGNLEKATILLAPSPEIRATKIPDEEDYMLTMADVQKAQVRAQLVVLSCCYSGRGEIRAEGVVGMCRAFLASGARAVVASLWAINDKATRKFMKKFYTCLKEGKSASTSLHLTMNYMRQVPRYSEPKYWAPFFVIGDDVTLKQHHLKTAKQ